MERNYTERRVIAIGSEVRIVRIGRITGLERDVEQAGVMSEAYNRAKPQRDLNFRAEPEW